LAAKALELVKAFESQASPAEGSFNLILRHFKALSDLNNFSPPALKARRLSIGFVKCYLELAGFGLNLTAEGNALELKPPQWGDPNYSNQADDPIWPLNCNLLKALELTNRHDACPELEEGDISLAESFFEHRASLDAGRGFKSLRVLKQLLGS
jgi:hypothetical protein